jgi:hypothetical protein
LFVYSLATLKIASSNQPENLRVRIALIILLGLTTGFTFSQPAVPINDDAGQHIFAFQEIEYMEDADG